MTPIMPDCLLLFWCQTGDIRHSQCEANGIETGRDHKYSDLLHLGLSAYVTCHAAQCLVNLLPVFDIISPSVQTGDDLQRSNNTATEVEITSIKALWIVVILKMSFQHRTPNADASQIVSVTLTLATGKAHSMLTV